MIKQPPDKIEFLLEILILLIISSMTVTISHTVGTVLVALAGFLAWYQISEKIVQIMQIKKYGYWI